MIRSYIASRPIRGRDWPQRVQGLVIRDYVQRQGLGAVGLSMTEWIMPENFSQLRAVAETLEAGDHLVLFSLYMLPAADATRTSLLDMVKGAGATLHAALEDMPFGQPLWDDLLLLEDVHGAR